MYLSTFRPPRISPRQFQKDASFIFQSWEVEMALEAYPTSHAAFLATDKNDDGKIDPEEWAGLAKKLGLKPNETKHLFPLLDTNGDGFILSLVLL